MPLQSWSHIDGQPNTLRNTGSGQVTVPVQDCLLGLLQLSPNWQADKDNTGIFSWKERHNAELLDWVWIVLRVRAGTPPALFSTLQVNGSRQRRHWAKIINAFFLQTPLLNKSQKHNSNEKTIRIKQYGASIMRLILEHMFFILEDNSAKQREGLFPFSTTSKSSSTFFNFIQTVNIGWFRYGALFFRQI